MAAAIDSASVVSTANGIAQAFQILWPIVTSILAYIAGHHVTTRKKKVKEEVPKA